MKICLLRCVFLPGWVLLSVWRHGLSIRQEAGWLTGRKLYLLEYHGSSNLFLDDVISADSHLYYWRNSSGWFFWDTQDAFKFLSADGTQTGDFKRFSCRSIAIISCSVYFFAYTGIYSMLTAHAAKVIAISFMLSRTLSGLSVICFPQARKK